MSKLLVVLPLALTMNIGPGIITAIIVMTGNKPIKKTLLYLAGAATGIVVMGFVAFLIFDFVITGGTSSGQSTTSQVLDYVVAGLLAVLGVWVFAQRRKAQKPNATG